MTTKLERLPNGRFIKKKQTTISPEDENKKLTLVIEILEELVQKIGATPYTKKLYDRLTKL